VVQAKVCVVVRSTMDVFDRFTAKSSDPIIEPMLQSVPDPFDSYGPPQSEDQIFSILAPLSIMTQPSSPSPATGTSMETATSTDKITSWLPKASNGDIFTHEATEWAGSPTSTPPRSVSPSASSRRHSNPPLAGQRKAETKLRSALSIINESHSQQNTEDTPSGQSFGSKDETPQLDTSQEPDWSFTYGQSPYEHTGDDPTTSHSSLFLPQSQSPPLPPDPDPGPPDRLHMGPQGLGQPTLAPAVS